MHAEAGDASRFVPLVFFLASERLPCGCGVGKLGALNHLFGARGLVGPGLVEERHESPVVAIDRSGAEVAPDDETENGEQVVKTLMGHCADGNRGPRQSRGPRPSHPVSKG